MSSAPSLVSVKGLERRYGTLEAVRGINFELRRGEVLGLLGLNGAGKTTTMQMISGALAPTSGEILIEGENHLEHPARTKKKIGYLPEHPPLHHELSVDEYLRYCARLRRVASSETRAAVAEAKSRCGLSDAGGRLIGNLSKGYQQRVGIAQAIVHSPAVVVLDEPTVGLDPVQIREIRRLIQELGRDHGVILSTHVLPEVQAVCDRVQILNQGMVVLDETLDTLRRSANALRVGLRRPPDPSEFERLPNVVGVECFEPGYFRIRHTPDAEIAEAFAECAVEGDWGLFELSAEQGALEEIFISLTLGEQADTGRRPAAPGDA